MTNLERSTLTGKAVPVKGNELDTDRIIPARYLKETTFDRMGDYLFFDARFDADGNEVAHPLNNPSYKEAEFMVVENNFGCGSSREHAPQAIMRYGIKALIGESFAEIFAGNCKALGMPVVTLPKENIDKLMSEIEANPDIELTINLENKKISVGETNYTLEISEERRQSFIQGSWDELATLKNNQPLIEKTANSLPYFSDFQ